MNWSNLFVIFRREVLDQVRDRRTLFMIFIFPILLYPILGYGIIQASAARESKPRIVVVVGAEYLPAEEPLLSPGGDGFNPRLLDSPQDTSPLLVQPESGKGPWGTPEWREQAIRNGTASAVMVIPPDLPRQFRDKNDVEIAILYRSVDEPSQNTYLRLRELLDRWKRGIVAARTKKDNLPQGYAQPIQVKGRDVATVQEVQGNTWSLIFPFLLVIMSLTGAFYPAVDLCAGEKERGTMETLLISPATRAEIVLGKFLTVMLASVMTAVLNLISMGLTGIILARKVASLAMEPTQRAAATVGLAPPTLQSALWMVLLLIPLAAFFSAVCVALAVLARSMKEGQYYMTPLYLVCLPLIFLTLIPETKLNLFYSLVPITGVALLLRALIMGDYATGGRFFLAVLVPTIVYAWMALRWAIDQFQREEVLFREAERFNVGVWLKHLVRDRQPMPTGGQAVLCFSLILSASWFLMEYTAIQGIGANLAAVAAGQFLILFPPLIMAVMLTSSPGRTLRLNWPAPRYFLLAIAF
ncbi:MAG TPA: ABC transporter permease subunit/CPBP intramembrane protease, partial [Isosphaeraceae bacterium]|nr:ABC transporter permease subunit/CPBP intramembrane protease [Isosphaeraceae bacterium]